MAVTATSIETIQTVLNSSDPDKLADATGMIDLGSMLSPISETITIAAAATLNLATQSTARLAANVIQSVRVVTAGTAAVGPRAVTDAGGTATATVALLSADGTTLTFEGTVTSVAVKWLPVPALPLSTRFASIT